MLFLRKFLKLPSPIDLGWSKYNALEDELFSDEPKGKTWQDWNRVVKKMHPIRYFIAETLADWIRYKLWLRVKRPISKAYYWFVSHFVPSRRYHMLDLRQPVGYRYGRQDVSEKMLYAMFNLLGEYLKEESVDLIPWYTHEQIEADVSMKTQQDALEEAKAIYYWWSVERGEEDKAKDDMRDLWWAAKKTKDPKKEEYWIKFLQMEYDMEAKTDEMISRLMKIRRTLWT